MNEKNDDITFSNLGLKESIIQILSKLDISTPSLIQQKTIPEVLQNKNVVFESETGTGKTFAYLLPLIQNLENCKSNEDKIIILAPTYELASQIKLTASQVTSLKASLFIGGTPIKRQIEVLKDKPQIIIGNPSRILELIHLKKLKTSNVRALVLDEADRLVSVEIADETKKLISTIPCDAQFIACTATLNQNTKQTLKGLFSNLSEIILPKEDILSKKITHYALFAESRDKISTLKSFILAENPEKLLVFTSRADQVENIAQKLQYKKVDCMALHAKTDKKERKAAIDRFRNGKCRILITSDLASRGLDIPGITHIVQMDLPSNEDFFVHRSGRTARAGKSGINVVIGDEYEMRKYAALEKKIGLKVYPKMLYKGKLVNPSDIQDFSEE
ncbi:MAG: DEAD/DEAH box helicase [Treponema sp.]|uniref:DEAD/DEAH box helicase n=1 Tax=Treponema sp. TaxID=166 RepID=UPI00298ECE1F|nr:DEAD/DEAH box helicase [Treponema sp.]MDD5812556.1 DEAD/DEAH box helicase [Treponema sp.]